MAKRGADETRVYTDWSGLEAIERSAKQRAIAMKAVKAGAKLVQQAAKAHAPKRKKSGALKQSLGIKAKKGSRGKSLAFAVIGARTKVEKTFKGKKIKPSNYAHLVEKGTQAHRVGKGSKLKATKKKAANQVGRLHPGAKAKPFLRPALASQSQAAGRVMLQVLGDEIRKALASAAAKQAKG